MAGSKFRVQSSGIMGLAHSINHRKVTISSGLCMFSANISTWYSVPGSSKTLVNSISVGKGLMYALLYWVSVPVSVSVETSVEKLPNKSSGLGSTKKKKKKRKTFS